MAKKPSTSSNPSKNESHPEVIGEGGEIHQQAGPGGDVLTTNFGVPISDDQNSERAGARGPDLLEDFVLREKIHHFDHERIPERIVHARGSGAHGYFELTKSLKKYSRAKILTDVGEKTEVFVRFSTVAGGAGSSDTPRDVRGFAVKFYTKEGNWDLVGNNIPVFFIQDAIKFPDLIHAAKMEADKGYPQAATAHDTFWDFISLMPESTHMVMWIMSDRTIPRSLRMIEGFGVHTFRLVNEKGESTFVKFHWKPILGLQSTCWDEAVKIAGADPDYHRRDLYDSIAMGAFPEWELGVQLFTQEQADSMPFDVLDATKLVPEEIIPIEIVGRMVLDRNPDNFFAETEQVAFLPSNVPPGIDVSDDPLLQGRLFSYLDTQLSRLGTPNWHLLPINRAKGCPFQNFQRDGQMQFDVPKGRANYEPNSLASVGEIAGPRETPQGYRSHETPVQGAKVRVRTESFKDHYSQARLFYNSQSKIEQAHLRSAIAFELSKVAHPHIRERVLANLRNVDEGLVSGVGEALGIEALPSASHPAAPVQEMPASPPLAIIDKYPATLEGRHVAILVTDGADGAVCKDLQKAIMKLGARVSIIVPKVYGAKLMDGSMLKGDGQLAGSPSVLFDAVALVVSQKGCAELLKDSAAIDFVSNAFIHLKAIGYTSDAMPLLDKANVDEDARVIDISDSVEAFVEAAAGREWMREPKVRMLA